MNLGKKAKTLKRVTLLAGSHIIKLVYRPKGITSPKVIGCTFKNIQGMLVSQSGNGDSPKLLGELQVRSLNVISS